MRRLTLLMLLFYLALSFKSFAQEDLLDELESEIEVDSIVTSAFKGLKIVNIESTKLVAEKDFFFIIAHRFGSIKGGLDEFFGLDTSSIRFSLIYSFADWFNIGISRSSYNKVYDLAIKYRFVQQEKGGFPFTIVGFSSVAANTAFDEDQFTDFEFKHRLTYLTEALISRKFTDKLSLQISPILFHENFVENDLQENTQFALGAGGRYKISKYVSINMDYAYHFNRASNSPFRNPLSLGVDIETGGHVFQLHLTNAQPMYDAGFLTNATGDWSEGDIYLGFNLSRVF